MSLTAKCCVKHATVKKVVTNVLMNKLFISHSSNDKKLVDKIINLCTSIGITPDDIFCSSFEGQGVKNGKRINSEIKNELSSAKATVYIITKNFITSTFCTQELGAACLSNEEKPFFIFKSNEITSDDLFGFIDASYKYSLFTTEGVSAFCEWLSDYFVITKKITIVNKAISFFLENAKEDIEILIENKDKSDKQLKKERTAFLESQYDDLPIGAKRIIAEIYFSDDGVGYYSLSNGTVGLLQAQFFVTRTSTISAGFMSFAFALQPWVRDFIKKNPTIKTELEKILRSKKQFYRDDSEY
jgi:hypothetical protein